MKPLQAISEMVQLDNSCVPEVAVVIVGFIGEDGAEGFKYHILGEPNLATTVGLLEIVQNSLLYHTE